MSDLAVVHGSRMQCPDKSWKRDVQCSALWLTHQITTLLDWPKPVGTWLDPINDLHWNAEIARLINGADFGARMIMVGWEKIVPKLKIKWENHGWELATTAWLIVLFIWVIEMYYFSALAGKVDIEHHCIEEKGIYLTLPLLYPRGQPPPLVLKYLKNLP